MIYVFDTSFVGTLIIPDEFNFLARKMYSKIENEELRYTPNLFWYEITNLFKNLLRRRRYTEKEVSEFYTRLESFNFIIDNESGIKYSQKLFRLCNEYNLSSYDAAYLELAERKKAMLCTMDENLRAAAKKRGVPVIKA